MKHPERIVENETAFETGKRSSYMRYDAVEEMLRGQAEGFDNQADVDEILTRKRLTADGRELVKKLEEAADIAARMWKYSEPYMRDK